MMKTAVIGAGRMGRRHIQVVRELGLELVGVCDASADSLAAARKDQAVPDNILFSDAEKMFAQVRPACVIVATTAPSHHLYVLAAVGAGAKKILCEKPMGVSLGQCRDMILRCKKAGAQLAINHQMRFMEQYTRPKQIVESAEFGGLSSVTVVAGNFGLAMNGSHYFEMFRYMTGEAIAEMSAWFSPGKLPNPRGPQFEDRAGSVRATTAGGKRFYMEIGSDQGHGMQVTYAGPFGRLTVDELAGAMQLAVRKPEHRNLPTTRYGMAWDEQSVKIQPADAVAPTREVLKALLAGQNYPNGNDGMHAVAALVAAYVSDESGHVPVKVDPDNLPGDRIFPWA